MSLTLKSIDFGVKLNAIGRHEKYKNGKISCILPFGINNSLWLSYI